VCDLFELDPSVRLPATNELRGGNERRSGAVVVTIFVSDSLFRVFLFSRSDLFQRRLFQLRPYSKVEDSLF
jgi:hypothetical protein